MKQQSSVLWMKRSAAVFLLSLFISCACLNISVSNAQDQLNKTPNIILFIADDIGWNDIGCYGNEQVKTPNLDRIAEQGMRFSNFYLTTSSCSPSRCSIISGRYPHNTGAAELHTPLPPSIKTFPSLLKQAGYYTAQAGKWHMGESAKQGFNAVYDKKKENGDGGEDLWISTLRERPRGKPFFMWFASYDAHRPWGANPFSGTHHYDSMIPPPYMADAPASKEDLARYYDEIFRFDHYVGLVENELKRQGILDNTIIMIMTDNGRPFPRAKTRVYDSGMKTFFILKWNNEKLAAGKVCSSLVSAVDIAPTVTALAGIKSYSGFQGKSFTSLFSDPASEFRNYVFAEHNWHDYEACERMVRTKDFLYNLNSRPKLSNPGPADVTSSPSFQDLKQLKTQNKLTAAQEDIFLVPRPEEELFDCREDPAQLNNIAPLKKYNAVKTELRKVLEQWRMETDDLIPDSLTKDWFNRANGKPLSGKRIRGTMPGGSNALHVTNGGPF